MNTDRCEKLNILVRVTRSAICHETPVHTYRVFEVERSVFSKVTVSDILSNKTSYEHVSGCEWPPRWSWLNPISRLDFVRFMFVGLDEERRLLKEGGHTGRTAGLRFGCCWLRKDT